MYMLEGGMRSWTKCFFFEHIFHFKKGKQKMWTNKTTCNEIRLRQRSDGDCLHALGVWYVQACRRVKLLYFETCTLFMNTWTWRCSLTMGVCTVSRDIFSHLHSHMVPRTLCRITGTRFQKLYSPLIKNHYVIQIKTHTKQNHITQIYVGAYILLHMCVPTMVSVALATGATNGNSPLILWWDGNSLKIISQYEWNTHKFNKTTSHKCTLVHVYSYVCALLPWYSSRSPQASVLYRDNYIETQEWSQILPF